MLKGFGQGGVPNLDIDHFKARATLFLTDSSKLCFYPPSTMSSPPSNSPTLDQAGDEQAAIKALVDKYAKSNLHDAEEDPAKVIQKDPSGLRSKQVYTRNELLSLCKSPLVKPPPDMPDLKQWFGSVVVTASFVLPTSFYN